MEIHRITVIDTEIHTDIQRNIYVIIYVIETERQRNIELQ